MLATDIEDYTNVMEEPPGGANYGTANGIPLQGHPEEDFLMKGGWGVVHPYKDGLKGNPGGSVVHPDMHVDESLLRAMALDEFGFTQEQVDEVYHRIGQGRESQLRADMDARVLAIRRSGGNMKQFSEATGINYKTVERAMARALARESS